MELNKENAIVSIASGTASGKKAGSEANRGVSTVSFQELVRSHSTSSDVFQGGNILPQAENFSQRPQGLPNENSTDSVKLITVGGGYVSNTFDLLIVGEQASEAEALTFAKESGLSAAAIDVIFNEYKSPSAEASLSSSSDSPRLAAAVPPLIAEEGNTANLLLARAELSGARGMGLPSSSESVSQELKGPAGERVTVTNSTGNRAELSGLGRMVSPRDSEGVSQELKGPAGERIAATNSTGNRAELSGLGSVVLPSDSEGITKDLKAPILPRGDTTELLLRRSALTTLLGSVPEGVANSVSSEARAGLSYASNSEGYLRSQADLAKTLSSDRLSANASAEVIVSEPKEMSSVKSNALEYLRNRTELFSERLRDSEGVIPPGSVVLKSGRARTEASLSMRNTKTADSAYEALASKAKFESILPGLPPLATTKDAPGQTLLTPSLSPDNLVFSGETRLSASTPGVTGSEAAKSILNQSAVNQEGLSELRERFTARLSSDLAQRLTAGFRGGTHNLEFDLLPEKLGRIGVRMEYHEGKLEAMISSTSNVTREVLGENLPRLRELLVNSGVNVASLDIDSGSQKYSQQNSPSGDREYAAREG
ncbi:flagellar hook-length control protein FliK, partial [Pseudomonadales bacterium]|nr:flagellar hook-length control protein FliK [Pseudomonadales bacterium]